MPKSRRIAIIGAGMGGLSLAIVLQRAGHQCIVYEQASALAKVGAGINLAPNSTRIFRRLGLEEKMLAAGIRPRAKYSRDGHTGEQMFSWPVAATEKKYGAPFIAFHRGALQDALYSELQAGSLRFGKRLKELHIDGNLVEIGFADGSVEVADIVVGADGVHSRTRAALFPDVKPEYYGTVAYRSLVATDLIEGARPDDNTKWWGPDRFVLTYYTHERRDELNVITGSPEHWGAGELTSKPATLAQLLDTFVDFHPEVQQVLRAAQNITKWPMLECTPFTPWNKGPVVLLGDACHATTPHMGQGAGMAFEDAIVLSRCIEEADEAPLDLVFKRYLSARYERTARIQRESHEHEFARTSLDVDWLYGYDAFDVPLPA
jgi:6-hydroxynicotinate 3-monooxygenase